MRRQDRAKCRTHAFLPNVHTHEIYSQLNSVPPIEFRSFRHRAKNARRVERKRTAENRPRLDSTLLSDTARHRNVIALWMVEAVLQPRRDGRTLWMTSPATHTDQLSYTFTYQKLCLPYIQHLSTPPSHLPTSFIRSHFTDTLLYPPFSIIVFHPSPLLYSCYSFMSAPRFPKTPILVKVVGKLEADQLSRL